MTELLDPARLHRFESELLGQLTHKVPDFLTTATARSTRAAGDAIERIVSSLLPGLLEDVTGQWVEDLSRRAMADARVRTLSGATYDIDIKTHRIGTTFSRSNIISVRRLAGFYEDPKNVFLVILVSYSVVGNAVTFASTTAVPIEWLSWKSLTLGNLGWGQIQFLDTPTFEVVESQDRAIWMTQLCDQLLDFYPREITKTTERLAYFRKARDVWASKQ